MRVILFLFSLVFLASCEKHITIVSDIPEREANEIIVFLASKGITANKTAAATSGAAVGGPSEGVMYNIIVDEKKEVESMAVLNRNGLPRKKAPTLLELFAKSGLISSEREENIRFQAGLAAQISGTIRQIDGVIDAVVELSIPEQQGVSLPGQEGEKKRIVAAVFVKHQGILDDPNSHLITKIKRLVSGSVAGLDVNDVTVISDRSRFTDINFKDAPESITPRAKEYVSIWSIVMAKGSTTRFRTLFFTLVLCMALFALLVGWMLWKFYPILRKRGMKKLFSLVPFRPHVDPEIEEASEPRGE
jgi:type III secretion protein J